MEQREVEQREVVSAAQQYRDDGYEVVVGPRGADLPDFLAGLNPDFLARKPNENVAVEVVTREEIKKRKNFFAYWIGKVNTEPDWRFDMVIVDTSPWTDKIVKGAREPSEQTVRDRNRQLRQNLKSEALEPTCLFAWSLLEASMRIVAQSYGMSLPDKSPSVVMAEIFTIGAISRSDLKTLERLLRVRNAVAHGLTTSKLDEKTVLKMTDMTEKLLSIAQDANQPVAGV